MKIYILFLGLVFFNFAKSQSNYEQSFKEQSSFYPAISDEIQLETGYIPEYYRLEMNMNPHQLDYSGRTTVYFTTTEALNEIEINAQPNLDIGIITYHNTVLSNYSRSGNVLTIPLPEIIPAGQLDSIAVNFSGEANATSSGLKRGFHDEVPVMETISEPWHGSSWWVCKDDLLDKPAKLDVFVTHPTEFKAASNGTLKLVTNLGNGNSKTHWQHNYPITTYLVAIAVTNYEEYNNSVQIGGTTIPIINYLYPETLNNWTESLDAVPSYITFLSEKWGEYPYKEEKYGHAQWNRNGGMEHATMSFMGNFNFGLVGHELAHQWFGDQVTCGTWHDIWINEGFAEYGDGLLTQEFKGENEFNNWKENNVSQITEENGGSVYNPDAENQSRIFNYRLSYAKGSMMIHLIRYMLKDDDVFFQFCRDFLNHPDFTYKYADTEDVKNVLESTTNQDWDEYFADWIYGEGHPIFDFYVNKDNQSNTVTVKITQSSSHNSVSFFETPIEVLFSGSGGQMEIRRFNLTTSPQTFTVSDLPFAVTSFIPNPNFDIVCQINSTVLNNEEFELDNSNQAVIYPNPAKNQFTIDHKFVIDEIKVFDATGKILYQITDVQSKKIEIPTSHWQKGAYMVQITAGTNVQLKKVLIK